MGTRHGVVVLTNDFTGPLRTRQFLFLRRILETGGLSGFEVASVANLQPESVEEAKTLIPSLDVRALFLGSWRTPVLLSGAVKGV